MTKLAKTVGWFLLAIIPFSLAMLAFLMAVVFGMLAILCEGLDNLCDKAIAKLARVLDKIDEVLQ